MKTLWLLTLELLLIPLICNSQTKNDEFFLSYGIYSSNGAHIDQFAYDFISVFSLGLYDAKPQNIRESGPFFISYKRVINSKFGYGMCAGVLNVKYDLKEGSLYSENYTIKQIKRSAYTFAPEVDFRYLRRENFNLYSTLGIGYSILKYKDSASESSATNGKVDFHLGLIGIRFGNNLGGFAELGLGYKGLINIGLNYRI